MQSQSAALNVKLYPLAIPEFDGSLHKWLAFKDTFETLVHNQDFPEAYKLGKLRQAIKAEAVPLVGGLYSGGYEEVWTALKARYDRKKPLVEIHVARFVNLEPQTIESSANLLKIVDTVTESLRALRVMKMPVEQLDALAVPIVASKLPNFTQTEWGMKVNTNDIPTLDELLSAHSVAAEILRWPRETQAQTPRPAKRTAPNSPRVAKSNVAVADDACKFCHSNLHRIQRCRELLAFAPELRFEKLKDKGVCYNCLGSGHFSRTCQSAGCRECGGRHNTMLCRSPRTDKVNAGSSTSAGLVEIKPQQQPQPPRNSEVARKE